MLYQAEFRIFVITNQSGVGRSFYTLETLHQIHQKMHDFVERAGGRIEGVLFCPHVPDDYCECRKPKAGLFKELEKILQTSLQGVPAIGDSWRDLQAADQVSAVPVLVKTGKGEKTFAEHQDELNSQYVYENLEEVTRKLILPNVDYANAIC
jgi:D-glycero-D-manno-heptose 1,7-bisphosphate phosphatase